MFLDLRMTLHPVNQWEIPAQTAKIASASFPKGNMYMKMYDELGVLYADSEFAALFPTTYGKSAMSPGKLALITVMQFAEGLSDRQAADAVRSRIDWKYALGLEITDSGFDCSVLSEFRARLCELDSVETLRKVWRQQYTFDHSGLIWRDPDRTGLPPNSICIESPYDIEARNSSKREINWTGYKVHLSETCDEQTPNLITHVETTAATTPDGEITSMIHQQLAQKDLLPQEHYVDAAYVDAYQLVESNQAYQVSLVGPVAVDTSWQAKLKTGFDVSAFVIDWDKQVAICPQGNSSRLWRTARDCNHNPLIEIVFERKTCAACPVRNLCTSSATAARKIKLRPRDEYQALVERRHQQQTPQFQQNYARRAGVEGTISQGVGRFDLRRTRYFGLAKTHLQHIATACAINLSRFFDWSNHATKARTRTSSFAKLRVHCA